MASDSVCASACERARETETKKRIELLNHNQFKVKVSILISFFVWFLFSFLYIISFDAIRSAFLLLVRSESVASIDIEFLPSPVHCTCWTVVMVATTITTTTTTLTYLNALIGSN